jgi:DNA polymerase-3 subunit alpha
MYSIRDAITRPDELAARCAELGLPACAITDHGNMHAAYKQYKLFKEHGVKPIIGAEFYYCEDNQEKSGYNHMILLAKNMDGYRQLCELSAISYTDGFYKKPRIDKALLTRFAGNVICTTACVFGKAQQLYLNNELDASVAEMRALQSIFGEDFYLEIADHGLEDEDKVRDYFRIVGPELGIKVLPATDTHYLKPDDKVIHNIFKQIAYNAGPSDDDGFPGTGYHVWSGDEMLVSFTQEEIDVTLEIADKCNTKFEFVGYHLPTFDTPIDEDSYECLRNWARSGMKAKKLEGDKVYEERFEYEMEALHLTELEDYFLIVADYIQWCRKEGIPVGPGRGSGAGSLISYLVGITTVDPIKYDLLFARCINPGRALQYDFGV